MFYLECLVQDCARMGGAEPAARLEVFWTRVVALTLSAMRFRLSPITPLQK
jgi:hypothetical protein